LAEKEKLKRLRIPVLFDDERTGLAVTYSTTEVTSRLSADSHLAGKCAGFEALPEDANPIEVLQQTAKIFDRLRASDTLPLLPAPVQTNPEIEEAISQVSEDNLRGFVQWLSAYPNWYNKGSQPNKHVDDLQIKLQQLAQKSQLRTVVTQISHRSTPQKSLRLRIEGSVRPDEILVLGAHLDSISGWGGSGAKAPGADDNASGSANLFEAV
jgi:leucyl aminopeptidase